VNAERLAETLRSLAAIGSVSRQEGALAAFERVIRSEREARAPDGLPRLETRVERSYSGTHIPAAHPLVDLAQRAAQRLGRGMRTKKSLTEALFRSWRSI